MIRQTKLSAYLRLIRAERPIGTYLVLWPTLIALWIAGNGHPSLKNIIIFCAGSWLMRSAGCAINDYADRHVDGSVARTALRPIATGELKPKQALAVFFGFSAMAALLVLQTNLHTSLLALAAVATTALYPFMKRYTHLPQVVLGVAFSFGIPMAFAAENTPLPVAAYLFWLAYVSWTIVYDTFYAMADRADDVKVGIKSTAILFGRNDRLITTVLQALVIALLSCAFWLFALGPLVFFGLAAVVICFSYQQYLIKNREPEACLRAFQNNHIALFLLLSTVILTLSVV